MPKRFISSDFWSDEWTEEISFKAKLLYIYLITSPYTSQAGMGQATDKKISNDTDLKKSELPLLFDELSKKVDRTGAWFWVKNFLRHQGMNPSFLKGALKYSKDTPFEKEFLLVNSEILKSININKQNRTDQEVSTPCLHDADTVPTPCHYKNSPSGEIKKYPYGEITTAIGAFNLSESEKAYISNLMDKGCIVDDFKKAKEENGKYLKKLDNENAARCVLEQKKIRESKKKGNGLAFAF